MLDYMIFFGLGLLALLIYGQYLEHKRRKKMFAKIQQEWGQSRDREYGYEEYQNISHYYLRYKGQKEVIDDITWNDLDMDRVFIAMNHTYSSIGQEYLYQMLREPAFDKAVLEERNRLAELFSKDKKVREALQELFCLVGRFKRLSITDYIYRFQEVDNNRGFIHILHMLALVIATGSIFVVPQIGIVLFIAVIALNVFAYYRTKSDIEGYFTSIFHILGLLDCGKAIIDLKIPELEAYNQELREIHKNIGNIKRGAGLIKAGDSMSGSLADMILDYIRILFHVDFIVFYSILKKITNHTNQLESLLKTLGQLEACLAIASFRKSLPFYTKPLLSEQAGLELITEEIYHPLVEHAIANSIHTDSSVLLTGSNASGKSTFLKTVAIGAILAQTIYTVPANSYKGRFYRIYSSMALKDNLEAQESYYMVEIKSLKRILDKKENGQIPLLCFIDEVLRGTNTVERIAASTQILSSLSTKNCLCFAATHDIELTYLLEKEYENYHFREEIKADDILFNYRLYRGRATTRNAIALLKIIGYGGQITKAAENMAEQFVKTGKWEETHS